MCVQPGTSAGSPPSFNPARGQITVDGSVHWLSMNNAYGMGYVIFAGGQNSGLKVSIKTQSLVAGLQQLQALKPTPFAVSAGDTVQLVPGCAKDIPTCTIFNNLLHFGGMPLVPNPQAAQ